MPDFDNDYADLAQMRLEAKIKRVYAEAYDDISKKLEKYTEQSRIKEKELEKKLKQGKITQKEFDDWKRNQAFRGQRWQDARDDISRQIYGARETATKMINGERKAVFIDNVNHSQYSIDKDFGFHLNFNLYDSATVTKLIREEPKLLPDLENPDPQKDYDWSRKQIANAITQGVIQGESIPDIGKRIGEKLESNSDSVIRLARTAMTSAQNAGRIEAMHNAEDMGIHVEKLWIATLDNRTRDAHQELDGQTAKRDEPFHSSLGDIMFPGDPDADPANVWNCRCSLGYEYPEYKSDAKRLARSGDGSGDWEEIPDLTYNQWKQWVADGKPDLTAQVQAVLSNIDRIKELLKNDDVDVYEVGKLFAQEMHERIAAAVDPTEAQRYQAELDKAEGDIALVDVLNGHGLLSGMWLDVIKRKTDGTDDGIVVAIEDGLKALGWSDTKVKVMFTNKLKTNSLSYDEYEKLVSAFEREKKKREANINELRKKVKNAGKVEGFKSAQLLKDTLSQFRLMGAEGIDLKSHLNNSRSPMRKVVEDAYNYYPTDWVKASILRGNLTPKKVDRGYYSDYAEVIAISQWGGEEQSIETAIHELGHRFERAVPEIRKQEKLFYEKRTAGEQLEWMGAGYDRSEVTKKDDFIHKYMGKDYGGTAYELVSMGFEYAYTHPETLRKDEDMESWIYGLLLTE